MERTRNPGGATVDTPAKWRELHVIPTRQDQPTPSRVVELTAEDGAELSAALYGSPLIQTEPMVLVLGVTPPAGREPELGARFPKLEEVQSAVNELAPAGTAWALPFMSAGPRGNEAELLGSTEPTYARLMQLRVEHARAAGVSS